MASLVLFLILLCSTLLGVVICLILQIRQQNNVNANVLRNAEALKDKQEKLLTKYLNQVRKKQELEGFVANPLWVARKLKKLIKSHDKLEPEVSIDSPLGKIILGLRVDSRFNGIDYTEIPITWIPQGTISGNWH